MSDPTEPHDDSDRLKPCPFCGSDAEVLTMPGEVEDVSAGALFVQCANSHCMASSALIYPLGDDPAPLLLERWNRRIQAALSQSAPQGVAETISMPMTEFLESVTGVLNIANKTCATLEQELNALRAQVSTGTNKYTGLYDMAVINVLKARVAELEQDAARYQCLREFNVDSYMASGSKEKLDLQIDGLIAAAKESK